MFGKTAAVILAFAIIAMAFVPVVSAHAPRDYTMKVNPNVGIDQPTPTGILRGQIACYHNLFSKEVLMTLQGTTQTKVLAVDADGSFEANDVAPGVYDLVLTDGNGGQPETTTVTIVAGQISNPYRNFIGHAVSFMDTPAKPVYRITEATYGATVCTQVLISPEVPAVPAVPAYYVDVGMHHGDYMKGCGNSYFYVGHNHGKYDRIAAVPAQPAIPAVYETQCNGETIDVTSNVQAVVDSGVLSFKFRNDMNPGGIVSLENVLLNEIEDPAYPIVKSVHIEYTVDGVEKTIDTMEYEVINL